VDVEEHTAKVISPSKSKVTLRKEQEASMIQPSKLTVKKEETKPLKPLEMTVSVTPSKTAQKSMGVAEISLGTVRAPAEVTIEATKPAEMYSTTMVVEDKKEPEEQAILITKERVHSTHEVTEISQTMEWDAGYVVDRRTGKRVKMEEAIERGLVQIDWETGIVTDCYTGERMTPEDAHRKGMIDTHILHLIETRRVSVKRFSVGDDITLNDAVTHGLLIIPLGRIRNPGTGARMTIEETIDTRFLDPDRSLIIDPATGRLMTLTEAIQTGIFDVHSGDIKNTATGKTLTLTEAIFEGLIPEKGLRRKGAIPVSEAIEQGLVDTTTGMYTDPNTGVTLEIQRAVELGYLEESEVKVIVTQRTITRGAPRRELVEAIPWDVAIEEGLINCERGTFHDKQTGELFTIGEAISFGYIKAPEKELTGLEDVDGVDFEVALQRGLIDIKANTFIEPITGVLMPLDAAIRKGYVILPEQGIRFKVYDGKEHVEETVTEQVLRQQANKGETFTTTVTASGQTFAEALEKGLIDLQSNTYTDPNTGRQLAIQDAIQEGLVDSAGERQSPGRTSGLTLTEAIDQSLFDESSGCFTDPQSGRMMSLQDAMNRGFINKDSAVYDTETRKLMTFQQALDEGRIDRRSGKFVDHKSGRTFSVKEATKLGLLAIVGAPALAGMAIADAIKRTRSKSRSVSQDRQTRSQEDLSLKFPDQNILEFTKIKEITTVDNGEQGMSVMEAISTGALDVQSGHVRDPRSGRPVPLKKALELRIIDPASAHVLDPISNDAVDLQGAYDRNLLNESGHYFDPERGLSYTFHEAISKGVIVEVQVDKEPRTKIVIFKETTKVAVDTIIDPRSRRGISLEKALNDNVINTDSGLYVNPNTGECVPVSEAYERGLIKGQVIDTVKTREEVIQGSFGSRTRSGGISGAVDPQTHQRITMSDAVARGIVDDQTGDYIDSQTGNVVSLKDAIDEGLIFTEETVTATSKTHRTPHQGSPLASHKVNIVGVIDPRNGEELTLTEAIRKGLFDSGSGVYINPINREIVPLDKAIRLGLVITQESRSKDLVDSRLGRIMSVKDTRSDEYISPATALQQGILDLNEGVYNDLRSRKVIPLPEAVRLHLVRMYEGFSVESICASAITTEQKQTLSIKGVLDPNTRELLHPAEAVSRGILDLDRGLYINIRTGETMLLHEAFEKGFIKADEADESDSAPVASATAILETKSYTIQAVIDTRTEEKITVSEAIARGILDNKVCRYHDIRNNETMSIQEAIDRGLIIADEGVDSAPGPSAVTHETRSFSIKSVIDPRTGEEIPISDAVRHKIVDKVKGEYVNLETDEVMPIAKAIEKGLVITEPVESAGQKLALVEVGFMPATKVYTLISVKDPENDTEYDPVEAERRGLINKIQGIYMNPITGDKISIREAIERGFIKAELIEEPDYADLPQDATHYATMEAVREQKSAHMVAVIDVRTGEEISVLEALQRGLVDPSTGAYTNPLTGEVFTMQQAVDKGLVKASVKSQGSSLFTQTPKLTKTFEVMSVVDPRTQENVSMPEAIRRGLVDPQTGMYIDVATGQKIPLDKAVEKGLVSTDGGEVKLVPTEELGSMKFHVETSRSSLASQSAVKHESGTSVVQRQLVDPRTGELLADAQQNVLDGQHFLGVGPDRDDGGTLQYTEALEKGLVDRENNRFTDPRTGETIPLDEAIKQGMIKVDVPVKIEKKSRTETFTVKREIERSVSPERKPTDSLPRGRRGDSAERGRMSFTEALSKGLVDMSTREFVDPNTGDRIPIEDAIRAGLLSGTDPGSRAPISLEEAIARGFVDPTSGTYRDPATGRQMTIDEAILLGLVEAGRSDRSLTPEESRWAVSYSDALQQGLIDPVTGTYTDPHSGRTVPLEEAMRKGLLQPKPPIAEEERRSKSKSKSKSRSRSKSADRPKGVRSLFPERASVQEPMQPAEMSLGRTTPNEAMEPIRHELKGSRVRYEEYSSTERTSGLNGAYPERLDSYDPASPMGQYDGASDRPPQSLSDLGPGAYITSPGYSVAPTGEVVNLQTGEGITIQQAVDRGLIDVDATQSERDADVSELSSTGVMSSMSSICDREHEPEVPALLVKHPDTGEWLSKQQAETEKIMDVKSGKYKQSDTEEAIPIEEAARQGLVRVLEPRESRPRSLDDVLSDSSLPESNTSDVSDKHSLSVTPMSEVETKDSRPISLASDLTSVTLTSDIVAKDSMLDSQGSDDTYLASSEPQESEISDSKSLPHTPETETPFESQRDDMTKIIEKEDIISATSPSESERELSPLRIEESREDVHEPTQKISEMETDKDEPLSQPIYPDDQSRESASKVATSMSLVEAVDSGSFDVEENMFTDPLTGRKMTFQEAIDKGYLNAEATSVVSPVSGDKMDLREAVKRGIVDLDKGIVVNLKTGDTVPLQDAISEGIVSEDTSIPTLEDLAKKGQYDVDSGVVKDTRSGKDVDLQTAIEMGLVDRTSVQVEDPSTGEQMTLPEAFDRGIMDPDTGSVINRNTGQTVSFAKSVKKGLLAAVLAPIAAPVLLGKLAKDYIDSKTGKVTDPKSGKKMTVEEAVRSGVIDKDISVVDPRTRKEIPISEAFSSGIVDPVTGHIVDASKEREITFLEGIEQGLIASVDVRSAEKQGPQMGPSLDETSLPDFPAHETTAPEQATEEIRVPEEEAVDKVDKLESTMEDLKDDDVDRKTVPDVELELEDTEKPRSTSKHILPSKEDEIGFPVSVHGAEDSECVEIKAPSYPEEPAGLSEQKTKLSTEEVEKPLNLDFNLGDQVAVGPEKEVLHIDEETDVDLKSKRIPSGEETGFPVSAHGAEDSEHAEIKAPSYPQEPAGLSEQKNKIEYRGS
jgi:hypothetical protein